MVKIALVGCGTVGSAFVRLFSKQVVEIERRHGIRLELSKIFTRNPKNSKCRHIYNRYPELFSDNLESILGDSEIGIVIEAAGGVDFAEKVIRESILSGKSVVTANKALLNNQWSQIFGLAKDNNVSIGYEAAVAGAVPIIRVVQESFPGKQIKSITGILNGTTNFILSEMERRKESFEAVFKEARYLRYAEADSSEDLSGIDSRNKLAILMRAVWGLNFDPATIYVQGIEDIIPEDFEYAGKKLGASIRLVAYCDDSGTGFVCPMFVPKDDLLARVPRQFNGIKVAGDSFGELSFVGPGAGGKETATAILADAVKIAKGTLVNDETTQSEKSELRNFRNIVFRHTLRFIVNDRPGIIRDISSALADEGISIQAVEQNDYPASRSSALPFLITLHPIREKSVQLALEKINRFPFMVKPVVVFRSFV